MILPRTAIYALRTMAVLANLAPGESIRSRELASSAGVPEHYVSKVMRRLVVAGLVDSQKGHGGGFRLSRAPDKIEFESILRAIDVELETGRCVFHYRACDAHSPCPLHESWAVLQEALKRWAAGTTLESTRATPLPPV
ncbi:MAG: Rrf2 family transcriptional regulator [Planctomycetes bacterium]|nr:Rrf2 family transcriptional regulator [Planctomycetota bacterium]